MKKRFPLLFFVLILTVHGIAQSKLPKETFSLSAGPSLPVGNYGSKKLTDKGAGYAGTGGSIAFHFNHRIGKRIGISASLQGQLNPLAVSSLEKSFNETAIADVVFWAGTSPGQVPPPPPSGTLYTNWQYKKKTWWTSSLLLGVYGEFPLNVEENCTLLANMAAGPAYVSAPAISGQSIGTTASAYQEQTGAKAWGIAYDVSIGIRKYLKGNWFLEFYASHYAAPSIKFKNIKASLTTTKGVYGQPDYSVSTMMVAGPAKQDINSLNLGFGAGFRF